MRWRRCADSLVAVLRSFFAAGRIAAGFALEAVADILVEQRCLVCGSRELSERPESLRGRPQEILLSPIEKRILLLQVRSRAVCCACASLFAEARTVGLLGRIHPGGLVVTSLGERFVPPGFTDPGSPVTRPGQAPGRKVPIVSPWMTNDPLLRIVHLLKYSGYSTLAVLMAASMAMALDRFSVPVDGETCLVPVPSSSDGERRSHALLLARLLAEHGGIDLEAGLLRKTRRTCRQSQTPMALRAQNVRGAFELAAFPPRQVILVDDVVTTGATAAACVAAIQEAGETSVWVASFGRAI